MSINIPDLIPKTPRLNWGFERHNQESDKANPKQIKVLKEALLNLEKGTSLREVKEFVRGKGYEVSIGALHKLWVKWFPDSPKLLA